MKSEMDIQGPEKAEEEKRGRFSFVYEGLTFQSDHEHLSILEIKAVVGQEPEVALAEIVDGRQVERPNDYVVHLARKPAFKRVPVFVRG